MLLRILANQRETSLTGRDPQRYAHVHRIVMEDDMFEHRVEARFEESIATVFGALVGVLAAGRWETLSANLEVAPVMPRSGARYSARHAGRLHSGEVLECIRPVSIVLHESAQRSAACAQTRMRWRIEPFESDTCLIGDLKVSLNRFAHFNRRYWHRHFVLQCEQVCALVGARLISGKVVDSSQRVAMGQSTGNESIVSANIKTVNGRPILR